MAIKQRALKKLDMTKKYILRVMRTRSKVALGEVYRNLTESRDLYREGLPRSGYAAYEEIYDGLILAVQKVMEGEEANFQEEVFALCQELLEYLERETAKETRFKKEIFFLPYKLSMFDSLESVWRAANEDKEHCVAYVMPIPYADRNPDQTVAAWHCERNQFPKDVPTLDWQQVDLKAWHPDIIVYHSPYDDCNAVTSVDEQYYSRNLRYCADKLVYIPYFVLIEPCTEESVEHFVTTPGVLNADKVIVQSEAMRELYINILTKRTNQPDRKYWEERISGAGSPKIEKVLTSKKEDFDMPEKWGKMVKGRKVILYNTSLTAMLQNSDKVCDKLRYVFGFFRDRDDVVLWWRPHPLMEATFHSMRPQFEEEYLHLEKKYIEEGWGIYDDSPDLHRAICWSDGYYGDMSSVVSLYKKTGKPIMLQEMAENFLSHQRWIDMGDLCVNGQKLYFINLNGTETFVGLFELSLISNSVSLVAELPAKFVNALEFLAIGCIEDKIIIAPYFSGEYFLEYDVNNKKVKKVPCLCDFGKKIADGIPAFSNIVRWNNSLFMISDTCNVIVEYNSTKNEYFYHKEWLDMSLIGGEDAYIGIAIHGVVQKGNLVCACLSNTNIIIILDLDSFQVEYVRLPFEYKAYIMVQDGTDFIILPRETEDIVYWHTADNTFVRYPSDYIEASVPTYSYAVSLCNKKIFLPYAKQIFGILENNNNTIHQEWKLDNETVIQPYMIGSQFFHFGCCDSENERAFAFYTPNRDLLEFRTSEGRIIHHKIKFPDFRDIVRHSNRYLHEPLYTIENSIFDKDSFIKEFNNKHILKHEDGLNGSKIMRHILSD